MRNHHASRTAASLMLAATLGLSIALPAGAQSERLENSLSTGGLNIAPRYLSRPGDVDLNLLGGAVTYPTNGSGLMGGQLSVQARITDGLQLLANMGPLAEVGLRGPIGTFQGWTVGWDARYRQDMYFVAASGTGLASTLFGVPLIGASASGAEFKLNGMLPFSGFNLFVSPVAASLSNRSYLGLDGGIDWSWDRLGLGYALSYHANLINPAEGTATLTPHELLHGMGIRYSLTDRHYLQANYLWQSADVYGLANQQILVGGGMRLFGETRKPAPVPVAVATPAPTPIPTPAPVATPVTQRVVLEGRFVHSLSEGGNPGTPLTARLKYRKPGTKGFEKVEATTQTDAQGNFRFEDLPLGEYQVFFKDEGRLGNVVDVAVGDAVKVKPGITRSEIDIAWDEQSFKAQLAGKTQTIDWADKLGVEDAVYQGLLRGTTGSQQLEFLNFPEKVGPQSEGSFTLSEAIKAEKVYYVIKYWKKDGLFNAETFYGQSKPIELKLP
ncbi:carboxypeptidase regulatory-like domain-containing protein [bacterium]|nr:carboxypeptidase regulatory-like domain-containing protein [bacterium]